MLRPSSPNHRWKHPHHLTSFSTKGILQGELGLALTITSLLRSPIKTDMLDSRGHLEVLIQWGQPGRRILTLHAKDRGIQRDPKPAPSAARRWCWPEKNPRESPQWKPKGELHQTILSWSCITSLDSQSPQIIPMSLKQNSIMHSLQTACCDQPSITDTHFSACLLLDVRMIHVSRLNCPCPCTPPLCS